MASVKEESFEEVVIIKNFSVSLEVHYLAKITHLINLKCVSYFSYFGIESNYILELTKNINLRNKLSEFSTRSYDIFFDEYIHESFEHPLHLVCQTNSGLVNLKYNKTYKTDLYRATKTPIIKLRKSSKKYDNLNNITIPIFHSTKVESNPMLPDVPPPPIDSKYSTYFRRLDRVKYNLQNSNLNSESESNEIRLKNFTLKKPRHNRHTKLSKIYISKLLKCNNMRMINSYFLRASKNGDSTKSISQTDTKLDKKVDAYSPIQRQTTIKSIRHRFMNHKYSSKSHCSITIEGLICQFSFRYICYIYHGDDTIEMIMKRQKKLKIERNIHSRITFKINDFLLNEEDSRYLKIIVEGMNKTHLICTVDLLDSIFPEWSVWRSGYVETPRKTSLD